MKTDRRRFLEIIGGLGAASLVPGLAGCGSGGSVSATPVRASTLAIGQIVAMPSTSAFVARDANGLYAFSSLCTHEGCDMRSNGGVKGAQVVCSCHNSTFDSSGNVLGGPARSALAHYAVTVNADDTVSVDTSTVVTPATRV